MGKYLLFMGLYRLLSVTRPLGSNFDYSFLGSDLGTRIRCVVVMMLVNVNVLAACLSAKPKQGFIESSEGSVQPQNYVPTSDRVSGTGGRMPRA